MNNEIPKESGRETKLRLLLCGDVSRKEFFAVAESFRAMEQNGDFEMTVCRHSEGCLRNIQENRQVYDLFVVLQDYSGQYTKSFYEQIRKKSPLSAIVIILGSLCEGEGRTGSPAMGGIRFYWHQWKTFGLPQFRVFIERKTGRFSLPVLTLDENIPENWPLEQGKDDSDSRLYPETKKNPIPSAVTTARQSVYIVAAEDLAMEKLLCEIYQARKHHVIKGTLNDLFERKGDWDRIVVDSIDLSRDDFYQKIRRVAHLFPLASIDILAFSPRIEEVERFREFPNCLVFPKPF